MVGRNDRHIFVGACDVTIYDPSNGYLFLGFNESVELNAKDVGHKIISGNKRQYTTEFNLDAVIYDTSQNMFDALKNRRDTKQKVYLAGLNSSVIIDNVYLNVGFEMPFSNDEAQILKISAFTEQENDVTHYINIMGQTGSFETGDATFGTGWGGGTTFTERKSPSFVTASFGGSYCQQFIFGPVSCSIIFPTYTSKKVTASIFGKMSGSVATDPNMKVGIAAFDFDDNLVTNNTGSFPDITGGTHKYAQVSTTIYTPYNTHIKRYEIKAWEANGVTAAQVDNAMIEFAPNKSTYKEY